MAGSDLQFELRGRRRLKGVEGTWQVFAVAAVGGESKTPALEAQEAEERRAAISPVAVSRRPTLVALALLAAVVIVAGVLVSQRGSPPPLEASGPPIGSLVLIDPETNRVGQVIRGAMPLATNPAAGVPRLAAGEGSVWVLSGLTVAAVDPHRGGVWKELSLGRGLDNKDVEVGYRTVWVLVQERLDRINPATGDVLGVTIRPELATFTGKIAFGREGVWLGGGESLLRLDPQTGRVNGQIRIPGRIDDLAIGAGSLWVADSSAATVFRVDPRNRRVVSTIEVRGRIDGIVVGEGYVWILDSALGTLSSIRPDTEEVRELARVGDDPSALSVGFGSVWVAGGEQGTALRINPNTLAQEEISVGGPVSGITVDRDERVVWVTIS